MPQSLHKKQTKSSWKKFGLICDDIDKLYTNYMNATNCDICNIAFSTGGRKKNMDHDHNTGLFRNFLCARCNNKRDRKNNTNIPNVSKCVGKQVHYKLKIQIDNKIVVCKRFKSYYKIVIYRWLIKELYGL